MITSCRAVPGWEREEDKQAHEDCSSRESQEYKKDSWSHGQVPRLYLLIFSSAKWGRALAAWAVQYVDKSSVKPLVLMEPVDCSELTGLRKEAVCQVPGWQGSQHFLQLDHMGTSQAALFSQNWTSDLNYGFSKRQLSINNLSQETGKEHVCVTAEWATKRVMSHTARKTLPLDPLCQQGKVSNWQ